MSKAYIPQNTWVVCTLQQNPGPGKLIATNFPKERTQFSVLYKGDKDLIFLTIGDRNTKDKFVCKKPMNMWLAIGGLVVGLILASNPIGWVVAGVCALVLIASVTVAIVTHDCSGPLKLGKWVGEKGDVYFDQQLAIIESSLLTCDKGGVLKPIIDEQVARDAAGAIALENFKEAAVTTVAAIATGFLMGKGGGFFKAVGGLFSKSGALLTVGGVATTYALTKYQSSVMRGSEEYANNEIYQSMNKAEVKDWSDPKTAVDETKETYGYAAASLAPPNLGDFVELYKTGKLVIQDAALRQRVDQLSSLSRQQLYRNANAISVWNDIKTNPNYERLYNTIRRSSSQNQARFTPSMRSGAINALDDNLKNNKWSLSNSESLLQKGSSSLLFFVPLIGGYFSESARRKLAEIAVKDNSGSISVRTDN
ncbi:hypothetical protein M2347_002517 [Chryseobacterium sp. H1D6B]|uniref:hypothetical protein n=1 Tax=Chryseobacterium sp. H1D6B TaxID=2940588 RepID=UPI0015CE34B0|nr:hypothetical protein [Chryseobacterium sp. H1D6B]MDH6252790.1 hypothetical protein [Chryseobacterium sp. H1D6B]